MLQVGSTSWILLQSMMAAVYSPRSMLISALRMRDLVYQGFSSRDLLRSSRALKVSFLLMKVRALFENIMAFSFLFEGSRLMASVYFCSASSNCWFLMNSLPSSLSCSHFFAVMRAFLHFLLSGSSLMPSVKYFFALPESPPQSSMTPLRYQKSGLFWSTPTLMDLQRVRAQVVSPVLARHSTLNYLSFQLLGILLLMQLTQERASLKSPASTAFWYFSKLE